MIMKDMKLYDLLKDMNPGPCYEAVDWLWFTEYDLETAWKECERGDWMLWLYYYTVGHDIYHTKAKADCASLVKHLMKDQRSLDALQACYDYYDGKITREKLDEFACAAEWVDNYYAADAACSAADADAYEAYNTYAAADADARFSTLKKCADICREVLNVDLIDKELMKKP